MDNVVSLFSNKQPVKKVSSDPSLEFITEHLMPWAMELGIDIDSIDFKLHAAGIMTMLQGILLQNDI